MKQRQEPSTVSPAGPLLGAGIVFLLLLLATAGAKSYRDLATARQRQLELSERIEQTRVRVQELERRIVRLRDDPVTLEHLAREELGMVYGEDVVIVIPETSPP